MYKRWTHSCSSKVGCYPMDCVEVSKVGCRIRAADDLDSTRNKYWFMPPPLYKCAYHHRKCQLSPCSSSNLKEGRTGVFNTTSWMKSGLTQVYNCQPLASEDMNEKQLAIFDKMTAPLSKETSVIMGRMLELKSKIVDKCPWLRPSEKNNLLRCKDNSHCDVTTHQHGWHCCAGLAKGGILACPRNKPLLCNDFTCDDAETQCRAYGGRKPCQDMEKCPWLFPTLQDKLLQCNDGTFCDIKKDWPCCTNAGGRMRCPNKYPVMCNEPCDKTKPRSDGNDFCCGKNKKDCDKKHGGVRLCDGVSFQNTVANLTSKSFAPVIETWT